MKAKRIETSEEKRKLIIKLHKQGNSYAKIAELVGSKKTTVHDTVKKFKATGVVKNMPRSGRPKKISSRNGNRIKRYVQQDRFMSAKKVTNILENSVGLHVHPRTVNRFLQKEGFKSFVPRKVPHISPKNVKLRLAYAKKYVHMPFSFWEKVIWTDESKYNIKKSDGRLRVWRKPGEAFSSNATIRTFKHGNGSVMVWGCMSSSGPGKLVFIEGIMNKEAYLNILKQNLVQSARDLGLADDFILVQDNDPKHKARVVMEYINKKGWEMLDHPPQSPDLNVIEHLWDEIDRRIDRREVNTIQQLKTKIQQAWSQITAEDCLKLVKSMSKRLAAVIKAKGANTSY